MAEGSLVPKPHPIHAQWAVISKRPGASNDYGVLAASQGGLDFSKVAWEYVAGVPSADFAADLPWVTLGTHPVDGGAPLLSISVQYSWTGEELDHTGRPIWPRAFFACLYSEVAKRRASYQTLCQALPDWLPGEDPRPIPLSVQPQLLEGKDGLYAMVEEFGFEQLAAIAAALFDGPVAVAGTTGMKLDQRLRLLDAIAALLPYEIRAELSASSAVSRKITPRMRLVLTDAPADGQQVIVLGESPPPQSPAARDYHRTLLQKKENSGQEAVVSHLWNLKEPCSLSQPGQVVQLLRILDRVPDLLKRILSAAAGNRLDLPLALEFFGESPPDVRRMWQQLKASDLDICYKLLIQLLNARGRDSEDALRRNWDTVLDQLDTLVNRQIDKAGPDQAAWCLGLVEATRPRSDQLLGRLLVPKPAPPVDTWPERIQARVALLGLRSVPSPGDYTYTCDTLRFNEVADWQARLVLALLTRDFEDPRAAERAAGWARWLSQPNLPQDWVYPAWVEALAFAVSGPAGPGSADRVVSVIGQAPAWVVPIVRLARMFEHLRTIVEIHGFDHLLLDLAMAPATGSDDLGGRLADALHVRFGATQPGVAAVDAARVLLGREPIDFPNSEPDARATGYFDGLTRVFAHLQADWPGYFQLRLLQYVVPAAAGPPGSAKLSAGAVQLIRKWCEDPDRAPDLAHYIADNELGQVLLGEHERLGPDIWPRLIAHDARLRPYGSVFQLRTAARQVISDPVTTLVRPTKKVIGESGHPEWGKGSTVLASAMYEAYLADMKMADILTVLAQETSSRGAVTLMTAVPPPVFLPVLNEFASLIRDTPPAAAQGIRMPDAVKKQAHLAESLWVHCLWLIAENGLLGRDYAAKFRRTLLGRSRYAQGIYVRVDEIFAHRRRFSLRRRPKPAELYEAWLAHGLPPEAWKPQPPRADPAAPTGGSGATTSPWPVSVRSTSSRTAVTQPVNPPLPGTLSPSPPTAPAKPSLPARIRSRFFVKPRFRAEGAHTADHESKQGTPS
jgi:hypothetical protein